MSVVNVEVKQKKSQQKRKKIKTINKKLLHYKYVYLYFSPPNHGTLKQWDNENDGNDDEDGDDVEMMSSKVFREDEDEGMKKKT